MAGPPPIPTEVKRLMGNPGKRRLPKPGEEPEPDHVSELPEPPEWLGSYGAAEWRRAGPILMKIRLLTESDLLAFGAYCANVDLMIESKFDIEKNGATITGQRGGSVRNPALASFSQAVTALRALATEFGMTPSSRARMRLPGDDGESLDDLMSDNNEDVE